MADSGLHASELARQFDPVPQLLRNVRLTPGQHPVETPQVQAAIAAAEARLLGRGRLLIRKSGTEPLVRVMAECEDDGLLQDVVGGIVAEIEGVV
jgi:phosphoglucosamine mutase